MARFEDAMAWITKGAPGVFARRTKWADVPDYTRTTPPLTFYRRWHIWQDDQSGIINGWGNTIGCADNSDPVRDGMLYRPTDEDRIAQDWELYEFWEGQTIKRSN